MSARSWFSINTTTNWSKLPVASGDRCPGGATVSGAAIGIMPDPRSATTTRRIAERAAPRARFMPVLAWAPRERRRGRPGADAGDPRGESGHQRVGRIPTPVAAICRLGAGYRKWLLHWEIESSTGMENEPGTDGKFGGPTN